MSTQQYRLLLVVANFVLLAAIGWLAYRTAVPAPRPAAEQLPKTFDPTPYEIKTQVNKPDPLTAYQVIAQQLDRPDRPKQTRIETPVDTGPKPPAVIPQNYTLVAAAYDPADPSRSSAILKDKRQQNHTIFVGSTFEGYNVRQIEVRGKGLQRVAIVTLDLRGKQHTVELKRQPPQ